MTDAVLGLFSFTVFDAFAVSQWNAISSTCGTVCVSNSFTTRSYEGKIDSSDIGIYSLSFPGTTWWFEFLSVVALIGNFTRIYYFPYNGGALVTLNSAVMSIVVGGVDDEGVESIVSTVLGLNSVLALHFGAPLFFGSWFFGRSFHQFIRRIRRYRYLNFRLISRTICRHRRVIVNGRNCSTSCRTTRHNGRYLMSASKGRHCIGVISNVHRLPRHTRRANRHARRPGREHATKSNDRGHRTFLRLNGLGVTSVLSNDLRVIRQASRATSTFFGRANQKDVRATAVDGNNFRFPTRSVVLCLVRRLKIFFPHLPSGVITFRRSMGTGSKRRTRSGRGPTTLSNRTPWVRFIKDICLYRCQVNAYGEIDRYQDRLNRWRRCVRRQERFLCSLAMHSGPECDTSLVDTYPVSASSDRKVF